MKASKVIGVEVVQLVVMNFGWGHEGIGLVEIIGGDLTPFITVKALSFHN